jgi:hypothetical protein
MDATKSTSKLNEIILIVKSGITGALALTGICIILFLLGFTARTPFVSYLYSKTLAKCSIEGLFIATGGFGFILGLIGRRRLPIIQKGIALMAVVAIPLIIGAWLLNAYAIRVSVPHAVKLLNCTNSVVKIHLKVPKGHAYHLELNTPGVQAMPNGTVTSSYKFSGHIRISNGVSLVADFPIGYDKAWLTGSCFVLTGVSFQNTNVPMLSQFIQAQKSYDIEITFDPSPPPSSSIWLYWLQSAKDRDR